MSYHHSVLMTFPSLHEDIEELIKQKLWQEVKRCKHHETMLSYSKQDMKKKNVICPIGNSLICMLVSRLNINAAFTKTRE